MRYKAAAVACSALFLALSFRLPVPEGMGDGGWVAFGLLLFSIMLWATELVPAAVTSLIVVALAPLLGVLTLEQATGHLGNDIIWLIVAMLIMGAAVKRTGLDRRMACRILHMAGGRANRMVLGLMAISCLLTFVIPNAMGRVAVMLPVGLGLIDSVRGKGGANFNKAVMLAITFVPYVSTIAVITAASGSIYAAGLFDSMLGYRWNYAHWLALMAPVVAVVLAALYWILTRLFPAASPDIEEARHYVAEERRKLGPLSPPEKKLIIVYTGLIALWATNGLHGIPLALSALLAVIALFLPGVRIAGWKEAAKEVDWGTPFVFTAGFVLAHALEASGFVAWLAAWATTALRSLSAFALVVVIMLLFIVIRLVFTSLTSMVASLMPVALAFAMSTPYNPVWLGMVCLTASSIAFILPSQSVGSLTTYALGHYSSKDMLLSGSLLTVAFAAAAVIAAFIYWPFAGLPIID